MSLTERISEQSSVTLFYWIDKYREILSGRELKPKTMKDYHARLKAVKLGMENISLYLITTRHIAEFIRSYEERGKYTSAKHLRSILNALFREAITEGHILANPVTATLNPKVKVQRSRLSLSEFKEILCCTEGMPHWVSLSIRLALVTGQRVSDISEGYLRVQQMKTGTKVAIPLTLRNEAIGEQLSVIIEECRSEIIADTILSNKVGSVITSSSIAVKFAEARAKTGNTWDSTPPSFHGIRACPQGFTPSRRARYSLKNCWGINRHK